jgi:hypothetical protein
LPKAGLLLLTTLASLLYLKIVLDSKQKWFHAIIVMMGSAVAYQIYAFFLNQQQLDRQIQRLIDEADQKGQQASGSSNSNDALSN